MKYMMDKEEYSAGMVKLSFWFSEFRKIVQLLNQGKTLADIKQINLAGNIFGAPTQERAVRIFNTVSGRVKMLDSAFYQLFADSDIATQKLIALIAIMQQDKLFFEFVYEVYREKLISGVDELADSDIRIFFKHKQLQSDRVAKWTEQTVTRLGLCYKTMLAEAGVIDRTTGKRRKILKPILDKALDNSLKRNGMDLVLQALTGVR